MDIAGSLYRELCLVPHWNAMFGSGGRAAAAVSELSPGSVLHSYGEPRHSAAWRHLAELGIALNVRRSDVTLIFVYFHSLSHPYIQPAPDSVPRQPSIHVRRRTVLRFGMLEGEAIVDADRAIYDPQGASAEVPFAANGSSASELALVMNETEAKSTDAARKALAQNKAAVLVVKRGPWGATVLTDDSEYHVPAYRSDRVFKIGSGDVFSAIFAHCWGEARLSPAEAADQASRSVAAYCATMMLPTLLQNTDPLPPVGLGRPGPILIEGVVNTIGRRYTMEEARFRLQELGLSVIAPALGDAAGPSPAAVLWIAKGREIGNAASLDPVPLVVLAEEHTDAVRSSVCDGSLVTDDFVTALYFVAWEAMRNPSEPESRSPRDVPLKTKRQGAS